MNYLFDKAVPYLLIVIVFFISTPIRADHFDILAFGDSLTQGLKRDASGVIWGITIPPNGLRVGGYEPQLENRFASITEHTAFVYNWGYGGERTTGGVNRIGSVLNSRVANYLLLVEGANDLYEGISTSTTKFNLGVMIDKCKAKNVKPILGTVTPNTTHPEGYIIPNSMNPMIIALAGEKNVPLANLYNALGSNWGYYNSGDGLHWSNAGDQKGAETWFAALKPFLPLAPPATIAASDGLFRDRIHVSWRSVSGATLYKVYRCSSVSTGSCVEIADVTTTSYDDMGAFGLTANYRVKACNSSGCSGFSDLATGSLKGIVIAPILEFLLLQ